MQYQTCDTGPFYLSKQKREEQRFDVQLDEDETKKCLHTID